jgi:hypothetical protein
MSLPFEFNNGTRWAMSKKGRSAQVWLPNVVGSTGNPPNLTLAIKLALASKSLIDFNWQLS